MATLREAEAARRTHADELAGKGAHAIGVERGIDFDVSGYVVVAYVEPGKNVDLPKLVATPRARKPVPLVLIRAERFQPEGFKPESL